MQGTNSDTVKRSSLFFYTGRKEPERVLVKAPSYTAIRNTEYMYNKHSTQTFQF